MILAVLTGDGNIFKLPEPDVKLHVARGLAAMPALLLKNLDYVVLAHLQIRF
ncbi:hypothetical protein [Lentilactobacillus buchneri]|uniref:hypothetical protein n=1 Tax=Lentilactobacillus buchneri TaxID=1581 RepID=UPI0002DC9FA2|nr:hypothetical protein [Lentilactobacillus buchneri]MCC6100728.1 hypothetical protein [Lactobacillus sp.]